VPGASTGRSLRDGERTEALCERIKAGQRRTRHLMKRAVALSDLFDRLAT